VISIFVVVKYVSAAKETHSKTSTISCTISLADKIKVVTAYCLSLEHCRFPDELKMEAAKANALTSKQ
jgi:hypothetical protein